MEPSILAALGTFAQDLQEEIPEAQAVIETLRRAELQLTRAQPVNRAGSACARTWLLYVHPAAHIGERFGLAPELLILLVPDREAQARDIEAAEDALRTGLRLDRGVVLVVARDAEAASRLASWVANTGRMYVFLHMAAVAEMRDPQAWLRDTLTRQLGTSDLFGAGLPVLGWDFFGRSGEIEAIRRHLSRGQPVGLFGLRKVGKTSVLLAIRDQLTVDCRASGGGAGSVPIHLDLLGVSFAEVNRAGVMRHLLKATHEALRQVALEPAQLGLDDRLGEWRFLRTLPAHRLEQTVVDVFEQLCEWGTATSDRQVILFIDEYERLLGRNSSAVPVEEGVQVLDYFRGLTQRYPGVFTFVIAGLNGRLASCPTLGDRQNPLFGFLVHYPLAGLTRHETTELVRTIGRRVSLAFDHEAMALIWRETGGHPYLARQFGRVVDRSVPLADRLRAGGFAVGRSCVEKLRQSFRNDVSETMAEMHRAVRELDNGLAETLPFVHAVPEDAPSAVSSLPAATVELAERYGLLARRDDGSWYLPAACFGDWLVANLGSSGREAAHA